MPAIAGVKNTNKRSRQSTAGSNTNDHFTADTSINHPPHTQRRRTNTPTLNRTVDQSLFGDKHKPVNLKQQIRSISRLLNKPSKLDIDTIQRKQTELRILNDQLVDKQRRDRLDRIDKKYKMVKFIERQKVLRRMRTLRRQLTSLTSTSRGASEEEKAIRVEMERVQADLDYIDYYPRGTKYIALFASSKAEANEKGERGQSESGGAATAEEDDDSDSELVVGGKHSKLQPLPATHEHKSNTVDNITTAATPPSTITSPSTTPPIDDPVKLAERAAELEAQRAAIREAVKRAKAKATSGDKKVVAAVVDAAVERREKRRKEMKDDFFVFEGQEKGEEKRSDDQEEAEEEEEGGEEEGRVEKRGEGRGRMQERRQDGRNDRDRQQRRDSRDGAGRQNDRRQRDDKFSNQRDGRPPFKQTGAARTDNNSGRPAQQQKRRRDDNGDAESSNQQHDSVGQQRSAYNPNKHVRVSEVKKTARKIVDDDMNETGNGAETQKVAVQRAEERKEGVDAESADAVEKEKGAKRKRKRSRKKTADKSVEQTEKAGDKQQRKQKPTQKGIEVVDAQPSTGGAADNGGLEQPTRAGGLGKGKQRIAATKKKGAEDDERKATKQQEADIRTQRREDVKSLLQLDDKQSDDES